MSTAPGISRSEGKLTNEQRAALAAFAERERINATVTSAVQEVLGSNLQQAVDQAVARALQERASASAPPGLSGPPIPITGDNLNHYATGSTAFMEVGRLKMDWSELEMPVATYSSALLITPMISPSNDIDGDVNDSRSLQDTKSQATRNRHASSMNITKPGKHDRLLTGFQTVEEIDTAIKLLFVLRKSFTSKNNANVVHSPRDSRNAFKRMQKSSDAPKRVGALKCAPKDSTHSHRSNSKLADDKHAYNAPWRFVTPSPPSMTTKQVDNKVYLWCAHCNKWQSHTTAEHTGNSTGKCATSARSQPSRQPGLDPYAGPAWIDAASKFLAEVQENPSAIDEGALMAIIEKRVP